MQHVSSKGSCKPNDLNIPDGREVYLPFYNSVLMLSVWESLGAADKIR